MDAVFRNQRFESLESEFSHRVSTLEMEVAHLHAELKVKEQILMKLVLASKYGSDLVNTTNSNMMESSAPS